MVTEYFIVFILFKSLLKIIYMVMLEKYEMFFIGKFIHRNSNFPLETIILNN